MLVGAVIGISHYYIEELGFRLCQFMARRGQMRRLAPGTKRLYQVMHPCIDALLLYYYYYYYYKEATRSLGP